MRRALALCALVLLAGAAAAGAAPRAEVTLGYQRFYDSACRCFKFRFFGAISSGAANEYVAVLQQKCGLTYATSFAGASTQTGGAWEVETYGSGPATFFARWNGQDSERIAFRPPLTPSVQKLSGGRYRVFVYAEQDMNGRIVELQRLATDLTRVAMARLARTTSYGSYTAAFTVRTRKLTMRVLVPDRTAAPCYAPAVSKTFTS